MSRTTHVRATRRIEASAAGVFALLSDPSHHPSLDGSGMLVDSITPGVLSGVGDVFTMRMHNDEMGSYAIDNHVVEFDRDRRIAWEPVLSAASREEDKPDIGHNLHHQWGYELEAIEAGATLVTEFFDCSTSPEQFQDALQSDWVSRSVPLAIAVSLEKLESLVKAN
jgi:hypothetical protein